MEHRDEQYFEAHFDGEVTESYGFLPVAEPLKELCETHRGWDVLAQKIPVLLKSGQVTEAINSMPLLPSDSKHLPGKYLSRASVVLSSLAHAYAFYTPKEQMATFPEALSKPWKEVCKRLGRTQMMRTVSDDFLSNWKLVDPSLPLTFDNLAPLVPSFIENEDNFMIRTIVMMERSFAPAIHLFAASQKAILAGDDASLIECMQGLGHIWKEVIKAFMHMAPKSYGNKQMVKLDQTRWALTFGKFGREVVAGEKGNSGIEIPMFQAMDIFIGRKSYKTELGKQALSRRFKLPHMHNVYMDALGKFSVRSYIESKGSTKLARELQKEFNLMLKGYEDFFNVHRKRAYSYIEISRLVGRTETNNAVLEDEKRSGCPMTVLNSQFLKSNAERFSFFEQSGFSVSPQKLVDILKSHVYLIWGLLFLMSILNAMGNKKNDVARALFLVVASFGIFLFINARKNDISKIIASIRGHQSKTNQLTQLQLTRFNSTRRCYVSLNGSVYDLTDYLELHPGGSKILMSKAGGDISKDFHMIHGIKTDMVQRNSKIKLIGTFFHSNPKNEVEKICSSFTERAREMQNNNFLKYTRSDAGELSFVHTESSVVVDTITNILSLQKSFLQSCGEDSSYQSDAKAETIREKLQKIITHFESINSKQLDHVHPKIDKDWSDFVRRIVQKQEDGLSLFKGYLIDNVSNKNVKEISRASTFFDQYYDAIKNTLDDFIDKHISDARDVSVRRSVSEPSAVCAM